mmetsp:Transcript_61645/g.160098  ORF Transcript_61645/g.160098 Transcript_61645/m.160098 type:complete len:145 (-) Transcript_61645:290-724(-)
MASATGDAEDGVAVGTTSGIGEAGGAVAAGAVEAMGVDPMVAMGDVTGATVGAVGMAPSVGSAARPPKRLPSAPRSGAPSALPHGDAAWLPGMPPMPGMPEPPDMPGIIMPIKSCTLVGNLALPRAQFHRNRVSRAPESTQYDA